MDAHLDYLRHLKESVETIRDIVEEAKVVQIILWYLDSGCLKHMTGDRSRLLNVVKKFIEIVRFRNDHFGAIMGYGDYVVGESVSLGIIFAQHVNLERAKKHTHKPKAENTNLEVLNTLHMDLCGPVRVQTINGKKYILVIVDDYSRFTWVMFLRSKDETPDVVIKKGYRIYNKRTRRIMETIHVQFDELTEPMAPLHLSTGPAPTFLTPGQISSGLVPNPAKRPGSPAQAVQVLVTSAGTPLSTTIDQNVPSPHISPSSSALQSYSSPPGIVAEPHFMEDHNIAPVDNNPFVNVVAPEPHSEALSSGDISSNESPYHHLNK
nr:integrase, catalytic region, zinc finger, CCHC-type, peptidase aspartic, catalytic [Tanacetum cinerariifolium]